MLKEQIAKGGWKAFLKEIGSSNTLGRRRLLDALHGAKEPVKLGELAYKAELCEVATEKFLKLLKEVGLLTKASSRKKGYKFVDDWKRPHGEVEPENPRAKEVVRLALSTDGGKTFPHSIKLTLEAPAGCSIRVQQE
jgi:hypothetical protein